MVRQGDVLLVPVRKLPPGLTRAPETTGKVVLAYGEVTGHHHRIETPEKAVLWDAGAERYLHVLERCDLLHEEHNTITLSPGVYLIPVQVSMTIDRLPRRVVD